MSQQFKDNEQKDGDEFGTLKLNIPNTKSIQQRLAANSHQLQREEEEKAEKAGKPQKKRQKPKKTSICFCGAPMCTIGPFVETQGE